MLATEEMHVRHTPHSSGLAVRSSSCPCAFGHARRDLDMCIVAGCGEALDWPSQNLNEKLELLQKARLGPGHDSEATVLNRCVTYSGSGLTWEADPRRAELAELGPQAGRPQWSAGGAKPNAALDHEELEPDGQKAEHSVSARLGYLA